MKKDDKKYHGKQDDTDQGGETGQGGKIEFREFIAASPKRDDQLSGDDKRRLLAAHDQFNRGVIKKQKTTREQRQALKEGRISLDQHRNGVAASAAASSQYKNHPLLSDKAQFSGIDRQLNTLPNENIAETNQEKREELQYQYNLVHRPQNAPKFNPKPLPR